MGEGGLVSFSCLQLEISDHTLERAAEQSSTSPQAIEESHSVSFGFTLGLVAKQNDTDVQPPLG
jgi:hypothetical protein